MKLAPPLVSFGNERPLMLAYPTMFGFLLLLTPESS
jgi:hypothetical protein